MNYRRAIWGVAPTNPSIQQYAGYFNGHVYVTGNIMGPSDERLKTNIESLNELNILNLLMQLEPSQYDLLSQEELRQQNLPPINVSRSRSFGLLAQDLERVFPEMVSESELYLDKQDLSAGTVAVKSVNYIALIPVLLAGIQEQQGRIDDLEARIEVLENLLQD